MEQTERTKAKLYENTLLLVNDLQKIFGNLDKETYQNVQYMIYCSLSLIADDVIEQGNLMPTRTQILKSKIHYLLYWTFGTQGRRKRP